MMGRNHLLAGSALAAAGSLWVQVLADRSSGPGRTLAMMTSWLPWDSARVLTFVKDWFFPVEWVGPPGWAMAACSIALFWIGSLLPDIDSRSSLLGRHVRFPGPHHGVMHTDWGPGLILLASVVPELRLLSWLWLGAWIHCELDGLSRAGRVRWYPFSKYRITDLSGGRGGSSARAVPCVVPAGYRRGLYRVGRRSERVVLGVVLAGCAVAGSVAAYLGLV